MLAATVTLATTACGAGGEEPRSPPAALPSEATAHFEAVVADLDAYWSEVITEEYSTPTVVAYRGGEVPETVCAEDTDADDWVEAPFYCFDDQTIVYDADFLADLYEQSNADAATAVLAHEWGHHLQALRGRPERSLQQELQADCLAGFFMGDQYGDLTEITEATNAMLLVAEAGNERYRQSAWFDRAEHGSPGMRVIAFTLGSITGPSSSGDLGFCDGYGSYQPQPPIQLGDYRLAHLPGFDHIEDSTGLTVSGGGVVMRIEPLNDAVLRDMSSPSEQVLAALAAYASEHAIEVETDPGSNPIVSQRPHGTLTEIAYAAPSGSMTRFGYFWLHRDKTGAAVITDSAAEISLDSALSSADEDEILLAGNLGRSVEFFLCSPSQSGDPASADYSFSCDLELEE